MVFPAFKYNARVRSNMREVVLPCVLIVLLALHDCVDMPEDRPHGLDVIVGLSEVVTPSILVIPVFEDPSLCLIGDSGDKGEIDLGELR